MASWPPVPAGGGGGAIKLTRRSGDWFWPCGTLNVATMGPAQDQLYLFPFVADSNYTLGAMTIDVSAGNVGSVVHLALYADDGGRPGALVLDAGTVSGAAAATPTTSAFASPPALTAGTVYWVGGVANVASPTLRSYGSGINQPFGMRIANGANPGAQAVAAYGYTQAGVTGALPNPFTGTALANNTFRVGFQVL